jgi:hypothetical protein
VLEVLDYLERLAPFSSPDMLVRDKLPSMAMVTPVAVARPVARDSLQLLRESLGR